jgi:catechol 2,3-dioxygenase-like lactoylglutathione lyase family enzyme
MEQRVDIITLGVPDLDAARRFYVDGLGWTPALDVPGDVIFLQVGHGRLLALWNVVNMAAELGVSPETLGPGGASLAHNVGSPEEVEQVIEDARAAGGTVLRPAQQASWGGRQGYFADPAGFVWEIAHNPGLIFAEDGGVRFAAVG